MGIKVIHMASPCLILDVEPENDLLIPAIEGTKNILLSISAHTPRVKCVVITSSFAAVANKQKWAWPEHTYTKNDWNPATDEVVKTANSGTSYCASKTFTEERQLY